ncbi:hypothetical protein BJY04DRAFT_194064 [Aspergillus karnatakaensis]|uniref:Zn(II)2Cys6 transcription factor n=1 Tax=Aspergillus karnatakaensis TaxID=1810916 RepID=UPI003CCE03F3
MSGQILPRTDWAPTEVEISHSSPTNCAFRCQFPGCNASYRRKAHLNRHERSSHIKQQVFSCSNCGHRFQRSDTLRRHIRKAHKILEPLSRARRACIGCHASKTRCEGGIPCEECVRRNIRCTFQEQAPILEERGIPSPMPLSQPITREESNSNYWEKKAKWINLYFETFHPRWPFIHRGTFDMRQENPLLLQSIIAIGMWSSGEQSAQSAAVELYDKLDYALRDQRPRWDASDVEGACSSCFWPIATYQAILLHVILSVIMKAGSVIEVNLKASIAASDLELLKSLIGSCRRLGMFSYPNMLNRHEQTEMLSFIWVSIEEVKRFGMALYKLCAKVSSSDTNGGPFLHARELQFPPPFNNPLWNAVERDDWEANATGVTISLHDDLREQWISNFAYVLELVGS